MAPHQQRVVEEKADLDVKIAALEKFQLTQTHAELSLRDMELLQQQQHHMVQYSSVLGHRIARF